MTLDTLSAMFKEMIDRWRTCEFCLVKFETRALPGSLAQRFCARCYSDGRAIMDAEERNEQG